MKKRIIIVIAAMVILCGILTGIGIILSDQKPEKQSEEKPEKVEQELEIKPKETQENTKQEMEERELESEPEKRDGTAGKRSRFCMIPPPPAYAVRTNLNGWEARVCLWSH